MNKKIKLLAVGMSLAVMLTASGCEDQKKPSAGAGGAKVQQSGKPAPKKVEVAVKLYYPDRQGMYLHEVTAKVDKDNKYKAAMQLLLAGPKEKKLMGIFPPGTKIRSLTVNNGRANIDFSHELMDNFPGGSMVEEMIVGSTVNTLTAFPEIKTVKISIAGKDTMILSNMDFVDPYERMPELIKK